MYNFKVLSSVVRAMQIDKSGSVVINGRKLCGDAGYWVVINETTNEQTVWPDDEFRTNFEPADQLAKEYLKNAMKKE